jgi:trans-aconitate methyltransferase
MNIVEVGCGPGAFYLVLKKLYPSINYVGFDYNEKFIEYLKSSNLDGEFICLDAINLPTLKQIDFCFSHSVFQYFPSHNYALKVIDSMAKMIKKGGRIAIYDLIDKNKRKNYLNSRMINTKQMESNNGPSPEDHLVFDKSLLDRKSVV